MSIATQVKRIKINVANSYTALEEKGATMPTKQNSDNLAETIANFQGSSTTYATSFKSIINNISEKIEVEQNL